MLVLKKALYDQLFLNRKKTAKFIKFAAKKIKKHIISYQFIDMKRMLVAKTRNI